MLFCIVSLNMTHAQGDKKFIRKGNREFEKDKFSESEILYRKAADKNKASPEAVFNIGDALYKQNKFEDAGKQFIENVKISDDNRKKAAGLYNLGNSLLMSEKLQESIEAYKGSLRLFPESQEAKYNLAYAQDLLKQQQQQQQKQQQQNKDQDDKNKEDQNKNQNKEDKQDNKGDQQQNKDKDQQQDRQQDQPQSISKEDAQRLLNAIANDEKNIQEKVKQAKAAKERVRTVKNW